MINRVIFCTGRNSFDGLPVHFFAQIGGNYLKYSDEVIEVGAKVSSKTNTKMYSKVGSKTGVQIIATDS